MEVKKKTLSCLIVTYGIICGVGVFPPVRKRGRSKQNDIVELWKFGLKMGVSQLNEECESWVVSKLIFLAECKLKNFGLSYYLVFLA